MIPRADSPLVTKELINRVWYDFLREIGLSIESSEQTIVNASVITIAHGFGTRPQRAEVLLVNKTTEYGFAVNEKVHIPLFEDVNDHGVQVSFDSTNTRLVIGANGIRIMRRDAGNEGQFAAITNGNWRLVARSWK